MTYDHRSPSTYPTIGQTPYSFIANRQTTTSASKQTPFIREGQQTAQEPNIRDFQSPYIANKQTSTQNPVIRNQQEPNIRNKQEPNIRNLSLIHI